MLEYGLSALALLILVVLLPRTIEFTSQGKRSAAVMPGGLERVGRAELASAVLGVIPVVLVILIDLLGGAVTIDQYPLAILVGMFLQFVGHYGGPFRRLLEDLHEARDRLDYNRVHGLPLDEPNRQTEKVS
jgi:MFS superfamily sulfate permease-like transporter